MKEYYDPWYVRLPDGHVVKAKSTTSVRHHVEAGNIPLNSMARRDSKQQWKTLTWIAEFTDLRPIHAVQLAPANHGGSANGSAEHVLKSGISARLDPMRLQTVGIRGLIDELIAALDSTVNAGKLIVACGVAVTGSLAVFLVMRVILAVYADGNWLAQLLAVLITGISLAAISALLTRQTHLELSTMRPVSTAEALAGIGSYILRVFLGYAATVGVVIGLLVLLQCVPDWLSKAMGSLNSTLAEIVQTAVWLLSVVLGVGLFIIMLSSLLIPPILVVEDCSVGDAIREWRALLREHRTRAMIYEGMAIALGLAAALPLMIPVQLALSYLPRSPLPSNWVTSAVPVVLDACAVGPAIAFMVIGNLFIYLNLRYEHSPAK